MEKTMSAKALKETSVAKPPPHPREHHKREGGKNLNHGGLGRVS